MTRGLTWLGLGAGLMYYLDPDRGRARRARVRERLTRALGEIDEAIEVWQETWSPTMRLLAGAAIGVTALRVAARGGLAGLALGALGAGLVARELADGRRGRGPCDHRASEWGLRGSRHAIATGAPIHDVAIPFPPPGLEEQQIGL
jgi:hypothetical protein